MHMTKYKVGDKVMVEADNAYGITDFVDGTIVELDGVLMVHVKGFDSGIETENKYDFDDQYLTLDEIVD